MDVPAHNQFTHPWTQFEIKFLERNIGKLTYKQISRIINRTPASIQTKVCHLPFQTKVKKHPINSDYFKTWSIEMAYVLGFIAADGNICHSGKAHTLHIACDDRDVIEKIKTVLTYQGPIHEKPRFNGKSSFSLRICDPIIFNDLLKLNITERKSLTFVPPKIPSDFLWHFIRGFFDGDGSVSLTNKHHPSRLVVNFYTASRPMVMFLQNTLKEALNDFYLGNINTKLAHQRTPYYVITLGHKAAAKMFDYMYNDATIYLDRKYQKFIEGINYAHQFRRS